MTPIAALSDEVFDEAEIRRRKADRVYREKYRLANQDKIREALKRWRQKNKSLVQAQKERYRAAHSAEIAAYKRNFREKNRDKLRISEAEYRAANRQKLLANMAAKRLRNIKARRLADKIYRTKNAEKVKTARAAGLAGRRARKKAASGHITAADILEMLRLQRGKCAHLWCRADIRVTRHVDHILPLALGGDNRRKNIQLLCPTCNLSKGAHHPIDHAQRNGLLL